MSELDIPDEAWVAVLREFLVARDVGNIDTVNAAVKVAAPLIVAAELERLAAHYLADIFTSDGTSRDAIAGTALRTVLTARARELRGGEG